MPKMGVDPNAVVAPKPVPSGWYKLKLKEVKAKKGKKNPNVVNLNALFEVVESGNKDHDGTRVYCMLAQNFARVWPDFTHSMGFPLESDGTLPGSWEFDKADPENVEKAQYKGPLLGRIAEAEIVVDNYNGNENNKIKQFKCKIDGCPVKFPDIKHLTNLIGNKDA